MVRERLKDQVRQEREKLKQLEQAWAEKQRRMHTHEVAMDNMVSGVAMEESEIRQQVTDVKDAIQRLMEGDFELAKRKLAEYLNLSK